MTLVMKRIQRLREEEKGITLIELLAVIVIIGVIAAIAVPIITGLLNDTRTNARTATANQIMEAAKLRSIAQQNGVIKGTHTLADLQAENYMQTGTTDPKTDSPLAGSTSVNLDNLSGTGTVVTLVVQGGDTVSYTADELRAGKGGNAGK